ncbi:hypothetical protein DNX69_24705 [Rhodopseudomonas palustris]|uniref:Uncharacterized protein n=1 Tax=Rhodopseudomonas palustris TaxID=1076 RepID=A0A323U933_RHOPL|nr:hypothetical protein [Rhodopseudomonas palustris]PZA09305.1 hypothetical protein DNX69_24705 [Rhodopseudomonas palustris]
MASRSDPEEQGDAGAAYAYKASLIGAAQQFELGEAGLIWRIGPKAGLWPYATIAKVRLSYRPVSMQSRRYRADIEDVSGGRLRILSTTWQTVALMAPQDQAYREFMLELHRRMRAAGSRAELIGGLPPMVHTAALVLIALVAAALTGLLARAVAVGSWSGALFLAGFALLFGWQIGGFIRRNRPRRYTFDDVPKDLLP